MAATVFPASILEIDAAATPTESLKLDANLANRLNQPLAESSLIQWLVTSAVEANGSAFVRLDAANGADPLEQLTNSVVGRVVATLPSGTIEGVSRQSAIAFRKKIFANQAKWPDFDIGGATALLCVDDISGGLSPQLYPGNELASQSQFEDFVNTLSKWVSLGTSESLSRALEIPSLSSLLYELFDNTQQHATRGPAGEHLSYSVRGIYSRYYELTKLNAAFASSESANPVRRYCEASQNVRRHDRVGPKAPQIRGFIEFSVFDSGPGFASKWIGRDATVLPIGEELTAAMQCFGAGHSTYSSVTRGFGLLKVLRILRRHGGLLRLRTGRLHLYREFEQLKDHLMKVDERGDTVPQETLLDWNRGLSTAPSEMKKVTGALVSAFFPMRA